jgi:hypothetical protein
MQNLHPPEPMQAAHPIDVVDVDPFPNPWFDKT